MSAKQRTHIERLALLNSGDSRRKERGRILGLSNKGRKHTKEQNLAKSKMTKKAYAEGERTPWNKGKTKEIDSRLIKQAEAIKGNIPWNKGKIGVYSEETLRNMREHHKKGIILSVDDVNEIKNLYLKEEMSIQDIVKVLGYPYSLIQGKLKELGISKDKGWKRRDKKLSKKTKRNMSIAQKKRFKDPVERAKITGKNNPFYGKTHKPETIEQMKRKLSILFSGENNPMWRGGYKDYKGKNWSQQNRLVRKRDNNCCQDCGITSKEKGRELDVHHIVPQRFFKIKEDSNGLKNLITLCHSCHIHREAKIWHKEGGGVSS